MWQLRNIRCTMTLRWQRTGFLPSSYLIRTPRPTFLKSSVESLKSWNKVFYDLLQAPADEIEQLVHELCFLHLGDVDNDFFAFAGEPAGLGVGASAAWQNEDAGIGPFQSLYVIGELLLGLRTFKSFAILRYIPAHIVGIDI